MTEKHSYDLDLRLDDLVSTHAIQFRLIPNGWRVLDVGCHTGILGEALRIQKGCRVTGIDVDRVALGPRSCAASGIFHCRGDLFRVFAATVADRSFSGPFCGKHYYYRQQELAPVTSGT